jgi:hypothetical protein
MKLLKNLALFALLLPLAVLALGLLAIARPQQARRIVRDAVAAYRRRAR